MTDIKTRLVIESKPVSLGSHYVSFYDNAKRRAVAKIGTNYMIDISLCFDGFRDDVFEAFKKDIKEMSDFTMYKYHIGFMITKALGAETSESFCEESDEYYRLDRLSNRVFNMTRRSDLAKIAQQEGIDTTNITYFSW